MMTTSEATEPRSVSCRPMVKRDRGFFAANWLKSFRRSDAVRGVERQTYFHFHHKILERLLARSIVIVACDQRDPDIIHGFVCFEVVASTCVLHYVYVRGSRRSQGIGSALLSESIRVCRPAPSALVWTHRTKGFDRWIDRYNAREERGLALLYNPYMIEKENHR